MREWKQESSLWIFIILAILLLLAGFIAGVAAPHHFDAVVQPALKRIEQIGANLVAGSPWKRVLVIFLNNTLVAVMFILLGIFLGIYPAWAMFINGAVMGVVCALVAAKKHVSLITVLVYAILPHGIFEMSALVWAAALGFNLGFVAGRGTLRTFLQMWPRPSSPASVPPLRGASPRREQTFQGEAKRAAKSLPIIIATLFVAACIEGLVTPHLIHLAGL